MHPLSDLEELLAQQVQDGELFEDTEFEASDSSILFDANEWPDHLVHMKDQVAWYRPQELNDLELTLLEGSHEIEQGAFADNWFINSLLTLASGTRHPGTHTIILLESITSDAYNSGSRVLLFIIVIYN